MITRAILILFYNFINFILTPITNLSNVVLNPEISNALTSLSAWLHNVEIFFPVSSLLGILGVFVVVETVILSYKLIKWGYSKIPGIT